MNHIRLLATKFRQGIEKAIECELLTKDSTFTTFPRGCCGIASELLAEYLMRKGIRTYYVCGTFTRDGNISTQDHAWLKTEDGVIIDITGDQFCNKAEFLYFDIKVFVGRDSEFHKLFEIEEDYSNYLVGLDTLRDSTFPSRITLYNFITNNL